LILLNEGMQTKATEGVKMSNAMVEAIMNLVTPQVTDSLAARLGGSTGAIRSGLGTSVAALLGGIANQAGESGFMGQVFNLVTGSDMQGILGSLSNLASGAEASSHATEQGLRLRSLLFGGQQTNVENVIGRQTGLGAAAGGELMSPQPDNARTARTRLLQRKRVRVVVITV
jgi:hypothetical protein